MGIYDRDYMRNDPAPPRRTGNRQAHQKHFAWRWIVIPAALLIFIIVVIQRNQLPKRGSAEVEDMLKDLEVITVPRRVDPPPRDANRATFDELIQIPYMTDASARDLIHRRPFSVWKELDDVYGIGPKKLESLKQYLYIAVDETVNEIAEQSAGEESPTRSDSTLHKNQNP